jgi:hypothetical protein
LSIKVIRFFVSLHQPQQQHFLLVFIFKKMVKKFSQLAQGGGHAKKIIKALHQYLDSASNGDIDALLEAYLRSRKGMRFLQKILNKFSNEKLSLLLERIRILHERASNNNKAQWLSLVSGIFTQRELIENYNFKFSKNAFATANRHRQENGPRAPTQKYGRPSKMTDDVKLAVKEFLYSVSYPSSHEVVSKRLRGGEREVIPVRYVDDTWDLLFHRFRSSFPNFRIGKSTFRKLCPKEIKKAKRLTDMCEYCELGKKTKAQLTKLLDMVFSNCRLCRNHEYLNFENCLTFRNLKEEDQRKILRMKKIVEAFEIHYNSKNKQSETFKRQVKHLKKGEVIFVLDFKENLKLGLEQVQLGRSFYNQPQRTMFEAVMIFKNDQNEIKYFYFDVFSRCLNHNALFVKEALSKIFRSENFKNQNVKLITFWMDNAKHFKNKELCFYFYDFYENFFKRKVNISWNYFIEGHGKNL